VEIDSRDKYFKRNDDLLLQQQTYSGDGDNHRVTIFTAADLEKAIENFCENRILDQGGQGTVYREMIMD